MANQEWGGQTFVHPRYGATPTPETVRRGGLPEDITDMETAIAALRHFLTDGAPEYTTDHVTLVCKNRASERVFRDLPFPPATLDEAERFGQVIGDMRRFNRVDF